VTDNALEMAADIVSAFVSNNSVPIADLPTVISSVHATLTGLAVGSTRPQVETAKEPPVSIKKSITPEFIICLEDGKKFKSLKRHLRTSYGLTPDQYRDKWKLSSDYPMVAPAYAERRSALAKASGLGEQRRKTVAKKK
jgi:predicted transcriptional regulator